jgi:hypothetical protein
MMYWFAPDPDFGEDRFPNHLKYIIDLKKRFELSSTPKVGDYISVKDFQVIPTSEIRNHDYSLKVTQVDEFHKEDRGTIGIFVEVNVPLRLA